MLGGYALCRGACQRLAAQRGSAGASGLLRALECDPLLCRLRGRRRLSRSRSSVPVRFL